MNKRIKVYRACLVVMIIVSTYTFFFINNLVNKQNFTNEKTRIASKVPSDSDMIMPIGMQIGVYLETEGVLVIGTDTITGVDGVNYDPAYNLVKEGDYIVALNDTDVNAKAQLSFLVKKYGNKEIELTIRRDDILMDVNIMPVKVDNGGYKLAENGLKIFVKG